METVLITDIIDEQGRKSSVVYIPENAKPFSLTISTRQPVPILADWVQEHCPDGCYISFSVNWETDTGWVSNGDAGWNISGVRFHFDTISDAMMFVLAFDGAVWEK